MKHHMQRQGIVGSQRIKEEMRPMKFNTLTLQLQVQERFSAKNKLYDTAASFSKQVNSQLRSDEANHNFKRAKSVELKDKRVQEAQALEMRNKMKQLKLQREENQMQKNEAYSNLVRKCNNAAAMNYDNL